MLNRKALRRFPRWVLLVSVWLVFLPILVEADEDVGHIAVIEADPTILQPGELFDLNNQTLTFTPKSGGGYTVTIGVLNFDPHLGNNLNLGDNDFVFGGLGVTFPFFGFNPTTAFVNSNGYLTFGSASLFVHFNEQSGGNVSELGDASTVLDRISEFSEEFQRIAVLWQDWDPSAGGGVFANALADRLIVTWNEVPLFGTSTIATFQVILFDTGVIQMNYQSVTTTPDGGYLTGISPFGRVTTLDFSQGSASSISTSPQFEPLVQVFGTTTDPPPLVHTPAVARRFYETHSDQFDQLVMFANFTYALLGNSFAFHQSVRPTVSGISLSLRDVSSFFGSQGRLQGFLNMNELDRYPADPDSPLGTSSTLDILGQETGHQWAAFVKFDDGGTNSDLLLGRRLSHWSFFHDTDASDIEGNKWRDNSDGTFTSTEATARFSPLDQYLMGLRSAGEVPTFFYIANPSATGCPVRDSKTDERSCPPQIGVTVNGTRRNVTIGEVIAAEGPRSPSNGFSNVNPTTTWNQAFILLIKAATAVPQADVDQLDTIRTAWIPYFEAATDNRGTVNTSLTSDPTISVTPNSLDFGNVNVGDSTDKDFTVRNTGGGTLSGNASTPAPFSIAVGGSYNLAAGASQNVTVRFSPTSRGTFMADVTFTGSGATKTVTGTGVGFTLTVAKAGSGSGTVTSSPAGIDCGSDCSKSFAEGTVVTLTANPAADSLFTGWSGGGGCPGTGACILTVNADTSVTANFDKIPRTLTVTKAGVGTGTVTSSPAGINCGSTCSATFDSGTSVTLTATASSGSTFAGWSGDCTGNTCSLTMNSNKSVTATFNVQQFTLTVNKAGTGSGTVTSSPAGINCGNDCSESYDIGTIVTLNATAATGSEFLGWSGGGCSGKGTCMLTINANITVTATFDSPGTPFTFSDDPLTSKVTSVKAKHPLEALEAINTLRQRIGLGTISFTAPIPAAGVPISRNHMITLQTGLNRIYDALGRTRPTFDSIVAGVTVVGKRQMDQIRNAIRAVETAPTQ